MKSGKVRRLPKLALATAALAAHAGIVAQAAELSWGGGGQVVGGGGQWDTSSLRWFDGSDFVAWDNAMNDTAVFSSTPGSVHAINPITFGGLSFTTNTYLTAASGSTYTWGGTNLSLNVNAGAFGTVFPSIVGSSGQTLDIGGGGTFRFFAGIGAVSTINLNAGTLQFFGAAADLSNATHLVMAPGTTFNMGTVGDTFGALSGSGTIAMLPQTLGIVTGPVLNVGIDNQSTTYSGTITGAGARFTKSGTGTTTLSGVNTFTGRVQVAAGTLALSGGSAISDQAYVGLTTGANLLLNNSETIGGLGSNGLTTIELQSNDLTIGADNFPLVQYGGVINGNGRLIKVGTGQQQFNLSANLSNYTGGTVLRGGQLMVIADRKLGAVPVAPTVNITFDGGAMVNANTLNLVLDANRSIEVTSNNGTFEVVNNSTVTRVVNYGGVISGAGKLTKDGPGSLVFTEQAGFGPLASHTYSGGTDIIDGQITSQLATTGVAGTPLGTGNVSMQYGRLSLLPTPVGGDILLAAATDPGRTFNYGPGSNLTIGRNTNTSVQLTMGPAGAGASSLVRDPNGTLVITPTNGIAELGLTSNGIRMLVNGGVPNANGGTPGTNGDMVSGSIISTTSLTDFTGEFLRYSGTDGFMQAQYSTAADLNLSTANDVFDAIANQVVGGAASAHALNVRNGVTISGAGGVTVGSGSGAAGVILNGATISTSTLGFGGAQGVLYAGGSAAGTESGIDSNITGSAGIAKVGNGVLILGGALNYTGPTNVSDGVLRLSSNNQLPSSTVVTVGNVGTLQLNGTEQTVANIHGSAAFVSGIDLGADGKLTIGAGDSTFLGVISGSGASTLVKDGAGVLTLGYPVSHANLTSNANTYNKLVLRNGAELNFSANTSLGAIPGNNANLALPGLPDAVTVDGGTLRFTGVTIGTNAPAAGAAQALSNNRGLVVGPGGAVIDVTDPLEILVYQRGNAEDAASTRNLITDLNPVTPGTITKRGEGFLRLGVGNQFGGKWVIEGGNLQFQADASLGVAPAALVPDAITINGGMIQSNGTGVLDPNRGVTVGPNGGRIQGFTINAPVSGAGNLNKVGTSTTILNASSPGWNGGLTISQGSVNFNADTAAGIGPITFDTANFVKIMGKTVATDVTLPNPIVLDEGGVADVRFASDRLNLDGNISGTANWGKGVTGASAGTLGLGGSASSFSGTFMVTDGTAVVTGAQALGSAAGPTVVNPGATLGFENVTYALPEPTYIAGAGVGGAGALVNFAGNNTYPGNITATQDATVAVPGGNLAVGNVNGNSIVTKIGPGTFTANHYRVNQLTINDAVAQVSQKGMAGDTAGTSRVKALNIAGGVTPTATLDLTNNGLVVDYDVAGNEPFDTIRAQIINAYNGGAWNQPGITSSLANASTHGVGYAEANLVFPATPAVFMGQTVDSTAVLVRYTRYGDADLNGVVNLSDFNRLAANFGSTNGTWLQGDFDYDGNVNLSDFNRLAANFGMMASPDGPTPEDWSALETAIPEPNSLISVCITGLIMLKRRRRYS